LQLLQRSTISKYRITFAQEKNKTSEIDDSGLITTTEIDESLENNTSQMANNISIIE
jgi:hypothetical protein